MRYAFLLALLTLSLVVYAGGDKQRKQNPIITTDGCVITIPSGIDTNACEATAPSGNGQVQVWFCPAEAVVTCVDE